MPIPIAFFFESRNKAITLENWLQLHLTEILKKSPFYPYTTFEKSDTYFRLYELKWDLFSILRFACKTQTKMVIIGEFWVL